MSTILNIYRFIYFFYVIEKNMLLFINNIQIEIFNKVTSNSDLAMLRLSRCSHTPVFKSHHCYGVYSFSHLHI